MDHDPMALLDGPPLPPPDPWESLARQAQGLTDFAGELGAMLPTDLVPTDERDLLAELDQRALAIQAIAAACRSHTYLALRDTMRATEIADAFGVSKQAVHKVLRRTTGPA